MPTTTSTTCDSSSSFHIGQARHNQPIQDWGERYHNMIHKNAHLRCVCHNELVRTASLPTQRNPNSIGSNMVLQINIWPSNLLRTSKYKTRKHRIKWGTTSSLRNSLISRKIHRGKERGVNGLPVEALAHRSAFSIKLYHQGHQRQMPCWQETRSSSLQ